MFGLNASTDGIHCQKIFAPELIKGASVMGHKIRDAGSYVQHLEGNGKSTGKNVYSLENIPNTIFSTHSMKRAAKVGGLSSSFCSFQAGEGR